MGMMGGGMPAGGATAGGQQQAAAAVKEEPKVEVKAEKTHFDIELTKFDAASKIKVIKEVRAILGLGLKEAKELVESAPQWIGKEVAKAEADKMVATLTAAGAECKLV